MVGLQTLNLTMVVQVLLLPSILIGIDFYKYWMNTYIMLIMLLQLDLSGYPYTTAMQEDPPREYATLRECESAAVIKREDMLKSSLKYLDMGIVDVRINCVDSSELEDGTIHI